MAFKLTKDELLDREKRADACRERATALETAVNAYNAAMAAQKEAVEKAVTDYNEALGELRGFCDDIASRIEGEFDDKSETWQEGERAQAITEWKDGWEGIDLDDIELELPDDIELPEMDHAGEVCNIDPEPSY